MIHFKNVIFEKLKKMENMDNKKEYEKEKIEEENVILNQNQIQIIEANNNTKKNNIYIEKYKNRILIVYISLFFFLTIFFFIYLYYQNSKSKNELMTSQKQNPENVTQLILNSIENKSNVKNITN